MEDYQLKLVYFDILNGYSKISADRFDEIFIKHSDNYSTLHLNSLYSFYHNKAIKSNIPAEKDKVKELQEEGLWTEKENKEIEEIDSLIKNMYKSKSKLFQSALQNQIKKQIEDEEKKLNDLKLKKEGLVGFTAEKYASKIINEKHIISSLFKDDKFEEPLFNIEQFEELDDGDLLKLVNLYKIGLENINSQNIKKIALSHYFTNYFYLSTSAQDFFGKSILELSFYQIELYSNATYFKNLLSNAKSEPPENVKSDPQKLVDWIEGTNNLQELEKGSNSDSGTQMIVGTKEDLQRMGMDKPSGGPDIIKLAMSKGGLSMEEIIKAQGK